MYFLRTPSVLALVKSVLMWFRLACVQCHVFLITSTQDKQNASWIVLLLSNICLFHSPSGQKMWTSVGTSRMEAVSSSVWTIPAGSTAPARKVTEYERMTSPSASVSQTNEPLHRVCVLYRLKCESVILTFSASPAVCDPPCHNYGVCVAPNSCDCPPGYPGPGCSGTIPDCVVVICLIGTWVQQLW